MDRLTKVSMLVNAKQGEKALRAGRALMHKENKTPFEAESAKAYRRTLIGTLILVALMVVVTVYVVFAFLPDMGTNVTRTGRVENGMIRYIHNDVTYADPQELGLSAFDLSENQKITLFFDSVTDEITEAYPTEYVQRYQNTGIAIILGNMVAWIVILLIYALVVCRLTPFGRAWTEYCIKQKAKEPKLSRKANLALSGIALVIALVIALPQLTELFGHMQRMRDIDRQRSIIQQGLAAGEAAGEMIENLENMQPAEADIQDVNDAAERIRQLLDEE